jgi:hypothetical protein
VTHIPTKLAAAKGFTKKEAMLLAHLIGKHIPQLADVVEQINKREPGPTRWWNELQELKQLVLACSEPKSGENFDILVSALKDGRLGSKMLASLPPEIQVRLDVEIEKASNTSGSEPLPLPEHLLEGDCQDG